MRGAPEIDGNFGDAAAHALAGTNVKRHVGPAPVIDEDFGGDESFRRGIRLHRRLLAVSGNVLTVDLALSILPCNYTRRNGLGRVRAEGLQNIEVLVARRGSIEIRARLDGGQRRE